MSHQCRSRGVDGVDGRWPEWAVRVEMAHGGSAEELRRWRYGHGVREAAEGVAEVCGIGAMLGEVESRGGGVEKLSTTGCSSPLDGTMSA
jgi:hypothetical protein